MILPDVNVFIYGHRKDVPEYPAFRIWWDDVLSSDSTFAVSEFVLSSFVRIVTGNRFFTVPSPLKGALQFVAEIRNHPNCVFVWPGTRHWTVFEDLCIAVHAKGNAISDAYLAALAIENGCEWVTTDRDFSRFPNLRWRHPLDKHRPVK